MFALLVKLVLPAAQALSINGYTRIPASIDSFAGTYRVVECKAAQSDIAQASFANGVLRITSGDQTLAEFEEATSDGYGHLTKIETQPRSAVYKTTMAKLDGKTLKLTAKTQSILSRGYGAIVETCLLEK